MVSLLWPSWAAWTTRKETSGSIHPGRDLILLHLGSENRLELFRKKRGSNLPFNSIATSWGTTGHPVPHDLSVRWPPSWLVQFIQRYFESFSILRGLRISRPQPLFHRFFSPRPRIKTPVLICGE